MIRYVIAVSLALAGCGAAQVRGVSVRRARVATAGLTLSSSDGSFTASGSEPFEPPEGAPLGASPCSSAGGPGPEDYAAGLAIGAQRVNVHYPGHDGLHGVLLFCSVHPEDRTPASRSFEIQVGEDRVLATSGGRISVTYELADPMGGSTRAGWVLWLSETPL